MSNDAVHWLDAQEEALWRTWLATHSAIQLEIDHQLRRESTLSPAEFEVLVMLTDEPAGVRMSELAERLSWERSRLSHQISRMERRGLVTREGCPQDGRGAIVSATDQGRQANADSAPGHLRTVREQFFDRLPASDQRELARILRRLG